MADVEEESSPTRRTHQADAGRSPTGNGKQLTTGTSSAAVGRGHLSQWLDNGYASAETSCQVTPLFPVRQCTSSGRLGQHGVTEAAAVSMTLSDSRRQAPWHSCDSLMTTDVVRNTAQHRYPWQPKGDKWSFPDGVDNNDRDVINRIQRLVDTDWKKPLETKDEDDRLGGSLFDSTTESQRKVDAMVGTSDFHVWNTDAGVRNSEVDLSVAGYGHVEDNAGRFLHRGDEKFVRGSEDICKENTSSYVCKTLGNEFTGNGSHTRITPFSNGGLPPVFFSKQTPSGSASTHQEDDSAAGQHGLNNKCLLRQRQPPTATQCRDFTQQTTEHVSTQTPVVVFVDAEIERVHESDVIARPLLALETDDDVAFIVARDQSTQTDPVTQQCDVIVSSRDFYTQTFGIITSNDDVIDDDTGANQTVLSLDVSSDENEVSFSDDGTVTSPRYDHDENCLPTVKNNAIKGLKPKISQRTSPLSTVVVRNQSGTQSRKSERKIKSKNDSRKRTGDGTGLERRDKNNRSAVDEKRNCCCNSCAQRQLADNTAILAMLSKLLAIEKRRHLSGETSTPTVDEPPVDQPSRTTRHETTDGRRRKEHVSTAVRNSPTNTGTTCLFSEVDRQKFDNRLAANLAIRHEGQGHGAQDRRRQRQTRSCGELDKSETERRQKHIRTMATTDNDRTMADNGNRTMTAGNTTRRRYSDDESIDNEIARHDANQCDRRRNFTYHDPSRHGRSSPVTWYRDVVDRYRDRHRSSDVAQLMRRAFRARPSPVNCDGFGYGRQPFQTSQRPLPNTSGPHPESPQAGNLQQVRQTWPITYGTVEPLMSPVEYFAPRPTTGNNFQRLPLATFRQVPWPSQPGLPVRTGATRMICFIPQAYT